MRTHGWSSDLPQDDAEARRRIIAATRRCVDRLGPEKTGLASVAAEVGVSRPTIYHYFPSTEALLRETGVEAAAEFLDRLAAHLVLLEDPLEILLESLIYSAEHLPVDPYVSLLLVTGHTESFVRSITTPLGRAAGLALLARLPIDWPALGADSGSLDELNELMLRTLQSLILEPLGRPEMRAYLDRWIRPALLAHLELGTARHRQGWG